MTRARVHVQAQSGFTLIEAMVALTILLAALVGTFTLVDAANSRSGNSRAREGATNLAREVIEQARTIKYSDLRETDPDLTGGTLLAELQTRPGLQDDLPGTAGWQSSRRGFTYTLVTTVCAVDDPGDKIGAHNDPAVRFCDDTLALPPGTEDGSPEDLRRVRIDVTYTDRSRTATVSMTATVNSTGQLTGPPITDLRLKTPIVTIGTQADPTVTTPAPSLVFTVTTSPSATKVYWSVDGQSMGQGTRVNATQWEFTWAIGAVSDGIYDVATQASNLQNEIGPERTMKVRLARLGAAAPADFVGGYNKVWKSGAEIWVGEMAWQASRERNVIGYRLYRPNGSIVPCDRANLSATYYRLTTCIDEAAPPQAGTTDAQRTYRVVAVFRDANNILAESSASTKILAPTEIAEPPTQRRAYLLQMAPAGPKPNCYATGDQQAMLIGTTGAASTITGQGRTIAFCSSPFAAGDRWETTAPTFSARVTQTLGNGASADCLITAYLSVNGAIPFISSWARITKTHPANGVVTWPNFAMAGPYTFAAGDRLNLILVFENQKNCNDVTLSYGGPLAGNPGQVGVTTTLVAPRVNSTRLAAPTGLTGTRSGSNVTLSWTPPAGGGVDFYRIYKGGREVYVNRKDTAGQGTATETWTDPEWDGSPYYVTAVSDNLVESPMAGPVTP